MFVISPGPQAALPVWGERERYFPVRRVYRALDNWRDGPSRAAAPSFSLIPPDALRPLPEALRPFRLDRPEARPKPQLLVALGRGGRDLPEESASELVWGWAMALTLSAPGSDPGDPGSEPLCLVSPLRPRAACPEPDRAELWLSVSGQTLCRAGLAGLLLSPARLIAALSRRRALAPGDLLLTGGPSPTRSLRPGDRVEGGISGAGVARFIVS